MVRLIGKYRSLCCGFCHNENIVKNREKNKIIHQANIANNNHKSKDLKLTCIHHGELPPEKIKLYGVKKSCLICIIARTRDYERRNKAAVDKRVKEYKVKNKEKIRARERQHYKNNPEYYAQRKLKDRYDLSEGEYEALLVACDHKCEICKNPETRVYLGEVTKLCIDHNHSTGKRRGVLCFLCNLYIGRLHESIEEIENDYSLFKTDDLKQSAIKYLKHHESKED